MDAVPRNAMDVFEMAAQVATLSEGFLAEGALERPKTRVLPEVVSQVAALLKDASTRGVSAFEIELNSLGLRVLDSDRLVPLFGDPFESLMLVSS